MPDSKVQESRQEVASIIEQTSRLVDELVDEVAQMIGVNAERLATARQEIRKGFDGLGAALPEDPR